LNNSGTRLDDFDLIIASCALAHNLTLVTNSLNHFSRIEGLKITNWSVYPEKNDEKLRRTGHRTQLPGYNCRRQ
jgi:hypothetical protein